jgi:hypothetical protein
VPSTSSSSGGWRFMLEGLHDQVKIDHVQNGLLPYDGKGQEKAIGFHFDDRSRTAISSAKAISTASCVLAICRLRR